MRCTNWWYPHTVQGSSVIKGHHTTCIHSTGHWSDHSCVMEFDNIVQMQVQKDVHSSVNVSECNTKMPHKDQWYCVSCRMRAVCRGKYMWHVPDHATLRCDTPDTITTSSSLPTSAIGFLSTPSMPWLLWLPYTALSLLQLLRSENGPFLLALNLSARSAGGR